MKEREKLLKFYQVCVIFTPHPLCGIFTRFTYLLQPELVGWGGLTPPPILYAHLKIILSTKISKYLGLGESLRHDTFLKINSDEKFGQKADSPLQLEDKIGKLIQILFIIHNSRQGTEKLYLNSVANTRNTDPDPL